MAAPFLILVYVALCALVAFLGRNSAVGCAGCFVLSLILTPFVMALILMIAAPRSKI